TIDLAEPALAVDVLRVLAAISESCGIGDLLRHPRPLDRPQVIQLLAQLLRTLGRDVSGSFRRLVRLVVRDIAPGAAIARRHPPQHIRYAAPRHAWARKS